MRGIALLFITIFFIAETSNAGPMRKSVNPYKSGNAYGMKGNRNLTSSASLYGPAGQPITKNIFSGTGRSKEFAAPVMKKKKENRKRKEKESAPYEPETLDEPRYRMKAPDHTSEFEHF